jgi:hypothetical protein
MLPRNGVDEFSSGTYKPTPAPATPYSCNSVAAPSSTPAGLYGATLSVFNGTNPNGTWSLYVYDDCEFGSGSIGGWSLQIAALGPVVTVPADIIVPNDPGQAGAVVNYTATGMDQFNNSLTAACTPPSGSLFPIGTTTVSCMVTDENGREATDSFTITVTDGEPPVLSVPGNITIETIDQNGTTVTFDAGATDNSGSTTVVCTPPSGSLFPIGTTTVTCTATDSASNSASASFTVTVDLADTEAPILSLPANIVVPADGPAGAVVTYTATATDDSGSATVTCVPPSGSTFSAGTTTVTCNATDASNNTASGSFSVTVVATATPSLSELLDRLRADTITVVTNSSAERSLVATIDQARTAASRGNSWGVYTSLLTYVVQIDRYIDTGAVSPAAAQQLVAEARLVLKALW